MAAGAISFFFPQELILTANRHPFLAMCIMLIAGIPMYVCATSSTPIAAALILKGLNPGAALVFLLAGPATNAATINVVKNMFSTRILMIYLGMISVCSLITGSLVDLLYSRMDIQASASVGQAAEIFPQPVLFSGAVILALLFILDTFKNTPDSR